MTSPIQVAVAANFQLPGAAADRLLISDGSTWRPLSEAERSALVPRSATTPSVLLFALPAHLRASFWAMMERGQTAEGFDAFASAVRRFLTFKQVATPDRALFELVLHGAAGKIEPHRLWMIINLGDEPVTTGIGGMRLRLGPGEGCQLSTDVPAEIIPPAGDTPHVVLLVREP